MNGKPIKEKTCPICKGKFTPWNSTQRVDSTTCTIEYNKQEDQKKADKQANKVHAVRKRAFQANDLKLRKKVAQQAFNAFIRKRDINEGCISCDKTESWKGQWHAGHFKTIGARSDLRFNEDNCHKQCSPCNNHLSGNIAEYTPRLIKKIGMVRFNTLAAVTIKKYTCEDYSKVERFYRLKVKELDRLTSG